MTIATSVELKANDRPAIVADCVFLLLPDDGRTGSATLVKPAYIETELTAIMGAIVLIGKNLTNSFYATHFHFQIDSRNTAIYRRSVTE